MQEGLRNTITCDSVSGHSDCEFLFVLKRMQATHGYLSIKADFFPIPKPAAQSETGKSEYISTIPTFNKDHKFYTPSFMLQEDLNNIGSSAASFLSNHQKKVEEFLEEKQQLFVPKPNKASRFCLICKEAYEDYLTHISHPTHNRLLKSSPFYNDIHELCNRISPQTKPSYTKKIIKQRKKKPTKASSKRNSITSQKSSESLSTGLQSQQIPQLCTLK